MDLFEESGGDRCVVKVIGVHYVWESEVHILWENDGCVR